MLTSTDALPKRVPGAGPQIPCSHREPVRFAFVTDDPKDRADAIKRICAGLAAARAEMEAELCAGM